MYRVTSGPQIPAVSREGSVTTFENQFWTVEHHSDHGNAPVSLRFTHGSGENLLSQPLLAHVGGYRPGRGRVFYRQSCRSDADVEVTEDKTGVILKTKGDFRDELGEALPISFQQTFHYQEWGHVAVQLKFIFHEQVSDLVELSPINLLANKKVNRFGYRHASGPNGVPSEPSIFWRDVEADRTWRSQRSASLNHIPLYWCVLREEIEGFEFFRGSDASKWDSFAGIESGQACFTYERTADNRHFQVRNELFNCFEIVIEPGEYDLDYHLGLPFIKPTEDVRNTYFHGRTRATDWPDSEEIQAMADAGVKVVRHHDDNVHREKGWPDGLYPPYPPEDMAEMDRMIRNMDETGIKVVPYFSMKEFNSQCPAFEENARNWARVSRKNIPIDGIDSCFGAYMCQRSGWVEYLKSSIDKVLDNHAFHGLYFDHLWPRECRHPAHCDGHLHSDIDAMIEFMKWARRRVGDDGFLFNHDSRCPCMIFENMSDLVVIGEGNLQNAPQPGGIDPEAVFLPITTRHNVHGVQTDDDRIRYPFFITMIQEGVPPNLTFEKPFAEQDAWMIGEYRKVAKYVTDPGYRHIPARHRPVRCPEGVFAAAFCKADEVILYVCNHHFEAVNACLVPDVLQFNFPWNSHFCVQTEKDRSERALFDILEAGINVSLSPVTSSLINLKRV